MDPGVYKAACLVVGGAVPHLLSHWAWGFPVLVPTGWWMRVGLGPEDNKLEGGFQNGACQYQCPRGRISSPKWLLLVSVSQCDPQLPSDSLWDSPNHQVGLTQVPFKLLLLPWVSVWNISVHCFKCGVFISQNPFVRGVCNFLSSVLL